MSEHGTRRSGRRVALVAAYPLKDPAMPRHFISNHGLRMVEASLRDAALDDLELMVLDLDEVDVDGVSASICDFDPDVVGFSTYLWSFPALLEVARRVKEDDPARLVVFGGPSARPSMFRLDPYRLADRFVDLLVVGEGELTFLEVLRRRDRSHSSLAEIEGIALHSADAWVETPAPARADLGTLPSPYKMDLVPRGGLAVLQTYRGCPFTCSFCEWGVLDAPKRVRESDDLTQELQAFARTGVSGALLVDAGLNLNAHSFKHLDEAARRSGFFEERQLICEVYPGKVGPVHIDFLRRVGHPLVGVGLQSFDDSVLANVERSMDQGRFDDNLHQLTEVSRVAIEIIMGLPGDGLESFMRTFERARSLPCALRVYHCVVLPSALMVRAPRHFAMTYDPHDLKMTSCLGWPEEDLARMCTYLGRRVVAEGGYAGKYFWVFPPPGSTREPRAARPEGPIAVPTW